MRTATKVGWGALATLALLVAAAQAALPTYVDFQLQARTSIGGSGFNVPGGWSLATTSPTLNDARQVAFNVSDSNLDDHMWTGQNGAGSVIAGPYAFASDPTINSAGTIAWRVFFDSPSGVFSAPFGGPGTFLTARPAGADDWGDPVINDSGLIAYRADVFGNNRHVVYNPVVDDVTTYADEADAEFGFLFTPNFNNAGQMSSKVLQGALSGPEQIRRWDAPGTGVILADESDGFSSFQNFTDMNNRGDVSFQARLATGGNAIAYAGDDGVHVLVDDVNDPFDSFNFFTPVINDDGIVAFSAVEAGLGEGVYVADTTGFQRVIGVGDNVMTDLGAAVVRDIINGLDINNAGDIVFNASLDLATGGGIGRGIFVAQVPEPATLGLVLVGGLLLLRRR